MAAAMRDDSARSAVCWRSISLSALLRRATSFSEPRLQPVEAIGGGSHVHAAQFQRLPCRNPGLEDAAAEFGLGVRRDPSVGELAQQIAFGGADLGNPLAAAAELVHDLVFLAPDIAQGLVERPQRLGTG